MGLGVTKLAMRTSTSILLPLGVFVAGGVFGALDAGGFGALELGMNASATRPLALGVFVAGGVFGALDAGGVVVFGALVLRRLSDSGADATRFPSINSLP